MATDPRQRKGPKPGSTDLAALRRMTLAERPDLVTFRDILVRTYRQPLTDGQRHEWERASRRYQELTGESV